MITERQKGLIDRCKKTGYGWRRFAESVEQSGKCAPKQEDSLIDMVLRIDTAERQFKSYSKNNINDCEIMSFGLHI